MSRLPFRYISVCLLLLVSQFVTIRITFADDCRSLPKYQILDFWLGEWAVYWNNELVGINKVEKVLGGCAILEHWKDIEGHEGKSLFYWDLTSQRWKQVWVTDNGSMKEKSYQRSGTDGSVLFQGTVTLMNGKKVLDRTTLYPLESQVRHVIEQSSDEGKTWKITFDGYYKRRSK